MNLFFGDLEELRQKAIPDLTPARERRKNYRSHPIDAGSEFYSDQIVDIRTFGIQGENFYHRPDNPPYYESIPGSIDRLLLRKSVALRLQVVDAKLRKSGLMIHVHDAIRPVEVQRYFHDEWMYKKIYEKSPNLNHDQIISEVEKYWAAPTTSESGPAPHSTGGAIDLAIHKIRNAEPLFMGSIFDDVTELAHTDHFELNATLQAYSDVEARRNRRLLYWLMVGAGFASNPNEWWHFSWGDQMWARLMGVEAAFFGPAAV
ncbi:MAG: M15 family metallopeptidase [Xanthobacteraceae bacterium]